MGRKKKIETNGVFVGLTKVSYKPYQLPVTPYSRRRLRRAEGRLGGARFFGCVGWLGAVTCKSVTAVRPVGGLVNRLGFSPQGKEKGRC